MCFRDDTWISHADRESAFQALKMPENWAREIEPKKAEIFFNRFRQWRDDICHRHNAALDEVEREALETGSHPSLSHGRQVEARVYADDLIAELRRRGVAFVTEVRVGLYHGDRLILTMMVDAGIDEEVVMKSLPCYYRGFEARWHRVKPSGEPSAPSGGV